MPAGEALDKAIDAALPLLRRAPRVWIALSGGQDSAALLELLAPRLTNLSATHIDHGLHAESAEWAERCRQRCARLGVACEVTRLGSPPTANVEAWARAGRYSVWRRLLQAGEVLVTAHQYDDQIETVALRLLQGRHPAPIPARRPLGAGQVLRPLLGVSRQRLIEASAAAGGPPGVVDPANSDPRFLRNRVRHQLLPALRADLIHTRAGAAWPAALVRLGDLVARLQRSISLREAPPPDACGLLARLPLSTLGPAGLLAILGRYGVGGVSTARAAATLNQLRGGSRAGSVFGTAQQRRIEAWRATDAPDTPEASEQLVLWRPPPEPPQGVVEPGASVALPHGELVVGTQSAPVNVRYARPGDRLRRGARTVRVVELLRAAGVDRFRRGAWPLVVDARGIVEVAGIAARDGAACRSLWRPSR